MTSRKLPHTGHEYWMIRVIFEHSHMTVHNVQIRYCLLQGTMVTQKFLYSLVPRPGSKTLEESWLSDITCDKHGMRVLHK